MDDNMRAKARATFGKEFMDQMKVQPLAKNGAVALQQRANARPIPTYKVGGAVKGMACGGKYADGGNVTDQRVAARLAAGNYKKGGKVHTSSDTARKLATEMGGMKKGGKAKKDGLAIMIAVGKPVKEKATGESYPSKAAMMKHEASESAGMERAERMMKPVKRAVGGTGKVRKGQAPIKRMDGGPIKMDEAASKLAKGGAGKVRKGMMSPEGKILKAVTPKKGIGGM